MRRLLVRSLSRPFALLFGATGLVGYFATASFLGASTFAPTPEELLNSSARAADARLDVSAMEVEVDSTGRQYYAIDDRRYPADAVQRDSAFTGNTWPGGVLYYQFASNVTTANRAAWRQAANTWSAVAGVSFVESTGNGNYVLVKNSGGNSSYIGMIGGAQEMQIYNWNMTYVMAHEIGHALGLEHEQSRSDRDSYVRILYANIQAGQSSNFDRVSSTNYGAYDFDSIMHYDRLAFTRNDQNTIEPLPAYASYLYTMGQRDQLSSLDAAGMAQRYANGPNLGNDLFVNRRPLSGSNGSITGNTAGAGREAGEPYHWQSTGGASVWHTWTAPRSGPVTMDTAGSNFDTVLAVYIGNSVSALTLIANNDDSGGGTQSLVTFNATAGVAYQIAVDGYGAATGTYNLRWAQAGGPANDNFSNRQPIYGAGGSIVQSNAGASNESGEPQHAGVAGGASVWFSWTAPASGTTTFHTLQSNIDTLLGIYTGNNLGSLSYIASNDNASAGVSQSSVSFYAFANVTYHIAVDARNGANGNVVLSWNGTAVRNARADFNGDGQSDLLWQNNLDGQRAIWFMNGSDWVAERLLPSVPLAWKIAGNGDFNGDGLSDIVWQNFSTGQRAIWLMDAAGNWIGERFLPTIAVEWKIASTGDFNGDGQTDLVGENQTTGQRAIWLMNGTSQIGERFLPTVATAWRIAGAADFTGDGQVDLLWQNLSTGQRAVWVMSGATMVGERFLPTVATAWRIVGSGNFNGDASPDIVWQNDSTGQRAIWWMNGTGQIGERFLPTIPTAWEMANH